MPAVVKTYLTTDNLRPDGPDQIRQLDAGQATLLSIPDPAGYSTIACLHSGVVAFGATECKYVFVWHVFAKCVSPLSYGGLSPPFLHPVIDGEAGEKADGHVRKEGRGDGRQKRDQIPARADVPDELRQIDPDEEHHRPDDR
jgi:hypothetical protein